MTDVEKQNLYVDAIINEIDSYKEDISNYSISSIYFGGGTPSLLTIDNINKIINRIYEFDVLDNIEVTFECNPESIDYDYYYFFFSCLFIFVLKMGSVSPKHFCFNLVIMCTLCMYFVVVF